MYEKNVRFFLALFVQFYASSIGNGVAFLMSRRECVRLVRRSFQLRSITRSGINGRAWNQILREDTSIVLGSMLVKGNDQLGASSWRCGKRCGKRAHSDPVGLRFAKLERHIGKIDRFFSISFYHRIRWWWRINVVVRGFIVVRARLLSPCQRDEIVEHDGILRVVPPVIIQRVQPIVLFLFHRK